MDGRSYILKSLVCCALHIIKYWCDLMHEGKTFESTTAVRVKIAEFRDGTYVEWQKLAKCSVAGSGRV
jgi:hypothetical protein